MADNHRLPSLIKKYWFLSALFLVSIITVVDATGTVAGLGRWVKVHYGADLVIALIFFGSGLILQPEEMRAGVRDAKGTVLSLVMIFVVSPLAAVVISLSPLPLDPGTRIGLFLVAVMPTTLTSGVVMAGAAGGNMAHALLVTLLANSLGVVTVPFSLTLLLGVEGGTGEVGIDKLRLMGQIGLLVLLPLFLALFLRLKGRGVAGSLSKGIPVVNQVLVLAIVWIALSGARGTVLKGAPDMVEIVWLSVLFHGLLWLAAFLLSRVFSLGPGSRESVVFMGGQKTLPLSVLLQMRFFPDCGLALAFCVVHHVIHLMMDGYLVARLSRAKQY